MVEIAKQVKFGSAFYNYFKILVVILSFYLLNVDFELAVAYLVILIASYIWFDKDPFISFPIERKTDNRTRSIIEVLIAYGGFYFLTSFLISQYAPTQSFVQLYAQITPILKDSVIMTVIGFGLLIPIVETVLFNGAMLEGLAEFANKRGFKGNLNTINSFSIMIVLIISAAFTLFHLSVRGVAGIPLIITFIFAFISCILVIRNKELKQAILLHIMTNTSVILAQVGVI